MLKKHWLLTIFLLLIVACIVIVIENKQLHVKYYDIESTKIGSNYDGYTIVQLSDLHNSEFGENNSVLIESIKSDHPNIIVITGDLMDKDSNIESIISLCTSLKEIAPIYYVNGNHEGRLTDYQYNYLVDSLIEIGVRVLENQALLLQQGDQQLQLIGIDDNNIDWSTLANTVNELKMSNEAYTILLSHKPQYVDAYNLCDVDLILSGHTHGGQIRLPFIGALIVPEQPLFPKYDQGLFELNDKSLIISNGLGESIVPIRFLCPRSYNVITLKSEQ